jgi:class 3 adenylate cyclase/tetratricopeptide (TPR) repeat protein
MICPSCGTENRADGKFCSECGTPLARACVSCGSPLRPGAKFCDECGTPVGGIAVRTPGSASAVPEPVAATPAAERRLVSVLFTDLVGFTTLSESRDPEEVRELLSRYFEDARRLIERYGGIVEKFIGDAVMAVWGTPVAKEDDAERAVRAALDLVAAVAALGQEVGAAGLQARAGVLTGEAAVTIGAEGQGMVAGDLVNTASRIQAAAMPGAVFVGESTRRSTEAAVAYEDAGTFELKGKAEPVPLWRALRVVAGVGGALKSVGLEAPFVGRDREMRVVKELFHGSAEDRKAHLLSVMGVAGIGKSRLSWEFYKYIDGLADSVRWHVGRCLAYGEGVTYWALAEMVRTRAGIAEGEGPDEAIPKLRKAVEEAISDLDERAWVEPRLAHLLGLEERVARDREDLFGAWRLFYERLADEMPTAMVFEDTQWADSALLDFIEYLLEWSKDSPLFILTLSRPELSDRRPTWGAGRRNFTSLYLEPLSPSAMEELTAGLVPGLPGELRQRILERAEGVPLYAVETIRMLLDRGLLTQEGSEYRVAGKVEDLEVPETLHALIAARLDGLTSEERWLLQDASVMGKTFSKAGLAAVTGIAGTEIDTLLSSLVRKEVLQVQADPRSPERGQYGFLQDLVKRVAYETLSKKERKTKHLAVAAYLESFSGFEEEEVVEVISSHYLEAYRAAPDAEDAPEIKARAMGKLEAAGEHAASLAASEEAQRYFEEAAELADDPSSRAELLERAGLMAFTAAKTEEAAAHFEEAVALFESNGQSHEAARVSARVAQIMWDGGKLGDAVERMERSYRVLTDEEPDENTATVAHQVGRLKFFSGHGEESLEPIERALEMAEALWLPEVLSQALNTKAIIITARGRQKEGLALLRYALEVALENEESAAALRAYFNVVDTLARADRHQEATELVSEGLMLARKLGNRYWEWALLGQMYPLFAVGEWDEVIEKLQLVPEDRLSEVRQVFGNFLAVRPLIYIHRGDVEEARRGIELLPDAERSADVQERMSYLLAHSLLEREAGNHSDALSLAKETISFHEALGMSSENVKEGMVVALESAFALSNVDEVDQLLATIEALPRGVRPPFLHAQALRFRARLLATRDEHEQVEARFKGAVGAFRELAMPFCMAQTLLDYGGWLVTQGRDDDAGPLLDEARAIFERLKATPWLERIDKLGVGRVETVSRG